MTLPVLQKLPRVAMRNRRGCPLWYPKAVAPGCTLMKVVGGIKVRGLKTALLSCLYRRLGVSPVCATFLVYRDGSVLKKEESS